MTSKELMKLAWEQSEMISDPYQKAKIYLEMAELLMEIESEKDANSCDCEKEFKTVKKKSSKEALKPAAEKAAEVIPEAKKDETAPASVETANKKEENLTVSVQVNEIDDTWTDKMYERFKEQYDGLMKIIAIHNLTAKKLATIVNRVTEGAWKPKGDLSKVDIKTREGLEAVGIYPKTVKLIYAWMMDVIAKHEEKQSA